MADTPPSESIVAQPTPGPWRQDCEGSLVVIAAAPDLLAACQAAVAAILHNADSGASDCDCDGDCEIALDLWTAAESLLRTAIARATGGAS